MPSSICSLLGFLVLQRVLVVTAKLQAVSKISDELFAARDALEAKAYHAGHAPYHVTRLHRYDHAGLESMLEHEAKWHKSVAERQQQATSPSGRVLKEARHIRGSISGEDAAEASSHSDFVQLSHRQVRALQQHHQQWASWLQSSANAEQSSSAEEWHANRGKGRPNGALIQKFKAYMTSNNQNRSAEDEIIATGLSSLNSQYVGPIGVGTVLDPPGCVMDAAAGDFSSLVETGEDGIPEFFDQVGGFISNVSRKVAAPFVSNSSGNMRASKLADVARAAKQAQANTAVGAKCKVADQSKIWVVFDTGSTNIWISSDLCKVGACRLPGRHMFNHSASATFSYPQSMLQLTVQFGTGQIIGPQAVDDFHIGPFTVYNQTFAMIETESGAVFNDVPFEGIVGMAFRKMSANGVQPFFDTVIQQKALKHNEFAFYFSKENPANNAIFWGGVDPTFYEGKLQYFPVVDPYYWSLKLLNFKVGQDQILGASEANQGSSSLLQGREWSGPVAIVDTGTTFFTAESDKFAEVMEKLPAAPCKDVSDATHPPITITLENVMGKASDFVLSNKQYMTTSGKGDSAQCSPAFMQIDLPEEHGPGMVLGEVFLRHFFAVFDRGNGDDVDAKLAFGKSSATDGTVRRLHELTIDQPKFSSKAVAGVN